MIEAFFAPIFFVVIVAVIGIGVVVARMRRRASTSVPRSAAPGDAETERRRHTG